MNRIILPILCLLLLWPLSAVAGEHRQLHARWEHSDGDDIAGFRIYHQNKIVCETYQPTARSLECEVFITGYPASFTATAYDRHGNESAHSLPFLFQPAGNLPPTAVITKDSAAGEAPHTVKFDASASFDPDGLITNYHWDFGDGQTATGHQVSHAFMAAGSYTVTLSVTDDRNSIGQALVTINVSDTSVPPVLSEPSAKIAVSPQEGQAPLMARFDALDSSAPYGELVNYQWDFGDGASGTGETINHIYTSPGIYTVKLTVTDNRGAKAESRLALTVRENTSTTAGFVFNFQPADIAPPEGYAPDSGSEFNQITGFGWITSPGKMGPRIRNSSQSPDAAHDTFIHVDPDGAWELTVPNGQYLVTVCVGDPAHPEGPQHVRVEGIPVIDNLWLSEDERWLVRDMVVSVQDERLTLTFEEAAPQTKLAWVRIEHPGAWRPAPDFPMDGAANVPLPVQFRWSTPPAGVLQILDSPVTYTLYYGTDPALESPALAADVSGSSILLAGTLIFGAIGLAARRKPERLLLPLALAGGLALQTSCSGGATDNLPPLTGKVVDMEVIERLTGNSYQAEGLQPGTTYYWKVVASDGQQVLESRKFSFTTE